MRFSCSGSYETAQTRLTQAQQMEKLITDMRDKQQEWHRLMGKPRRSRKSKQPIKRLPRGECTPREGYRLPILRALVALSGKGRVRDVLARIYDEMKSQLKPVDLQSLPSDTKIPRWRNSAMWERQRMVDAGLLASDSPRGVWTITESGRVYLRQHQG